MSVAEVSVNCTVPAVLARLVNVAQFTKLLELWIVTFTLAGPLKVRTT